MLPITVFTPTYNRAHLLPRVYKSLCGLDLDFNVDPDLDIFIGLNIATKNSQSQGQSQRLKESKSTFEWLIVDDGSTDNTREVVEEIYSKHTAPFAIRYIYKRNGGKHTAVNVGVQEAKGELFFIVDADDWLPPHSIKWVNEAFDKVKNDQSFAGVCGLDCFEDETIVGSGLPKHTIDCNAFDIRYKYRVTGDMKEVFRTNVLKEIPFPEFVGEKFCPEALAWNRIAKKYKLRYVNEPIYCCEYQENGLTANIVRVRHYSPLASMTTYAELFHSPVPFKERIKAAINYWRFTPRCYYRKIVEMNMLNFMSFISLPVGIAMRLNDIKKMK